MASPELETERLPRRPLRLSALALLTICAVVVGVALAGKAAPHPAREASSPGNATTHASPSAGGAQVAGIAPTPSAPDRPLPDAIDCGTIEPGVCLAMVRAAGASLPADAPPAREMMLSRSLLCDTAFDCPPDLLGRSSPLGSAVVTFVDHGPEAWINVIEVPGTGGESMPEAWVVSWRPEPTVSEPALRGPAPSAAPSSGPLPGGRIPSGPVARPVVAPRRMPV